MINLSERVVKVRLSAQVAEYQQGMLKAAQSTRAVGTEAEKLAQKRQAFEQLGKASLTAGGLIGAGVAVAVKKFADFDEAMSKVEATGSDARNSIDALRDAAIEAGASTVFSATESANAIEEMAKAGVSAKDILSGGLRGALDLAAAGGLEVADAAGIASVALKTFGLEGGDVSHVADLLAAGAGKAMGDVQDLSQALAQGGQVAAATGLSIEETTAALASFASQGLLGSDAGTSLKTMLQRLTPQSKEAEAAFDNLGISAYDANGQFVGLSDFAGQLQTSMRDLTPEARNAAMAVMFGSDAVRAANVLFSEGEEGIRGWIRQVDDQGYAAETAATKLDNLKGDWEALNGAIDSGLITMGSAADGPLRGLVQGLTGLVDNFNELPDAGQQAVFWIGAVGGAGALALGTYLTLVPKVADFKVALDELGPGAQKAARGVGAVTRVAAGLAILGTATVGVQMLADALAEELGPSAESVTNKIATATGAVELFEGGLMARGLHNTQAASDLVRQLGGALDEMSSKAGQWWNPLSSGAEEVRVTATKVGEELGKLATSDLPAAQEQFRMLAEQADLSTKQQMTLINEMPAFRDALTSQASALKMNADDATLLALALGTAEPATTEAAAATAQLAEEADAAAADLDAMKDALDGVADTAISMYSAIDDAQGSLNALANAAKDGKASLEGTNDESIRLRDTMRDVEQSHRDAAEAIIENGGSLDEAKKKWAEGREQIVRQRIALGESEEAARAWADEQLGSASEVQGALADVKSAVQSLPDAEISVTANTASAVNTLQGFINRYGQLQGSINYRATTTSGSAGGRATGGAIHGPGTGTSDDIPAMLSNGEHVLTAADVIAMGGQAKVYEFRRGLHSSEVQAFATGGEVTLARAKSNVSRAEARYRKAKTKKGREAAKDALEDAREELASIRADFRSDLREWDRENRRGENRRAGENGNGLSLVDRLTAVADRTGGEYGNRLRARALKQEKEYLRLETAADGAAKAVEKSSNHLDSLKDRVAQMAASVSNSLRRTFDVSAWTAGTRQVASTRNVDGVAVTSVTSQNVPLTAGGIAADAKSKAAAIERFQKKLSAMRAKGYAPALVEEIAMLGTTAGEPVADAMLAGTAAEMNSINASYKAAGSFADLAGDQSAKAQIEDGKSMRELIALADKQLKADERYAERVEAKLQNLTDQILGVLSAALRGGVKKAGGGPIVGAGTATSDSIAAWLSNGENVWSAADVQAWGGQSGVERLKRMAPTMPRFAFGGPVGTGGAGFAADERHVELNFINHNPVVRDLDSEIRAAAQRAVAVLEGI